MKKALTLLLASLLLLTSCASPAAENPDAPAESSETPSAAEEEVVVEEEIPYVDTLEQKDFDGYSYRMLAQHTASRQNFGMSDEITGEVLQDAIFQRKLKTMDKLNITIEEIGYEDRGQLKTDANKTIKAADDAYDIIITSMSDGINTLAQNGDLLDLTTIPYLTLDSERWNASMAKDMRIDGKQFFTTGVTSVCYLYTPQLVLFNQKVATENNLPNMYEMVLNHTWTIDKMDELMEGIAIDLNGDGMMKIEDDRFAMEVEGTFGNALYMSAGLMCVYPDESGSWALHLGDPASIDLIDKCAAIFNDPNKVYCDLNASNATMYNAAFTEGRGLFFSSTVWTAVDFRAMESDFGVLPIPLLNEGDNYRNSCNTWLPSGIAVPITAHELDRIGLIMETMAAYSFDYIMPAICEKTLGKTARDEESYQILEMIYQCTAFDFNTIMDFSGTSGLLRGAVIGATENFTSEYKKIEKPAAKLLEKFIEACRSQGAEE